ncbi:hypothetical protein LTS01_003372 [Friedmanniomyces endolithicus]|nr:hypothetical protein LTS01_003372 [Friedmanniomyces endolithicus]
MSQAPAQLTSPSPPSVHDTEMTHNSVSTSCTSSDVTMSDADEDPAPLFSHESPPKTASTSISASSNSDSRPHSPSLSRPRRSSSAERSSRATLSCLPGLEEHLSTLTPYKRARALYDVCYDYPDEYLAWMYAHPADIDGVAALRGPQDAEMKKWGERVWREMTGREVRVLERGQRKLFGGWNGWGEERRGGVREGVEEEVGPRGEVQPGGEAEVEGMGMGMSRAGRRWMGTWTRSGVSWRGEGGEGFDGGE